MLCYSNFWKFCGPQHSVTNTTRGPRVVLFVLSVLWPSLIIYYIIALEHWVLFLEYKSHVLELILESSCDKRFLRKCSYLRIDMLTKNHSPDKDGVLCILSLRSFYVIRYAIDAQRVTNSVGKAPPTLVTNCFNLIKYQNYLKLRKSTQLALKLLNFKITLNAASTNRNIGPPTHPEQKTTCCSTCTSSLISSSHHSYRRSGISEPLGPPLAPCTSNFPHHRLNNF